MAWRSLLVPRVNLAGGRTQAKQRRSRGAWGRRQALRAELAAFAYAIAAPRGPAGEFAFNFPRCQLHRPVNLELDRVVSRMQNILLLGQAPEAIEPRRIGAPLERNLVGVVLIEQE